MTKSKDESPEPKVFLGVGAATDGNDKAVEHPEAGSEAFGVPADLAVGAPDPDAPTDEDAPAASKAKDAKEKK